MTSKTQYRKTHLYVFAKTYSELLVGLFLGVALCEALLAWFYSGSPNPSFVHGIEGSPFSPHIILGTMWSVLFMAGAILWFYIWKLEPTGGSDSRSINQQQSAPTPSYTSANNALH